jgi:hypothetical protein
LRVLQKNGGNALVPASAILAEYLPEGNTPESAPRIAHSRDFGSMTGIHNAYRIAGLRIVKIRGVTAQKCLAHILHMKNDDSVVLDAGRFAEEPLTA